MQICNRRSAWFFNLFISVILLIFSTSSFASSIVISGNHIINTPTVYQNVVLDMTNGRFTINTGGSLLIENSEINTTISSGNPYAVLLTNGTLTLKNNVVNVMTSGITPNPNIKAPYQLIQVKQGNVNIDGNSLLINLAYTVAFFETQNLATSGFSIKNNTIKNFHGGIYLNNSENARVSDNTFENVSLSNIFNMGDSNKFKRNLFSFPGNLVLGNAFDIIHSSEINISDNVIASGSNYGIYINGGKNILIDNNKISDGSSYAIFIDTPSLTATVKNKYLAQILPKKMGSMSANYNIQITNNYIAQNRYGLTAGEVDHLTVLNNIFIQRFVDNSTRKYWTNNDNLLPIATNLTWVDNLYKEAFTQEVPGDNSNTLQFVPFPAHGGVFLP